jgi:hypothetical protein
MQVTFNLGENILPFGALLINVINFILQTSIPEPKHNILFKYYSKEDPFFKFYFIISLLIIVLLIIIFSKTQGVNQLIYVLSLFCLFTFLIYMTVKWRKTECDDYLELISKSDNPEQVKKPFGMKMFLLNEQENVDKNDLGYFPYFVHLGSFVVVIIYLILDGAKENQLPIFFSFIMWCSIILYLRFMWQRNDKVTIKEACKIFRDKKH